MSYYSDELNDEIDDYDEDQSIRQLIGASKYTSWIKVVGVCGLTIGLLLSIFAFYSDFKTSVAFYGELMYYFEQDPMAFFVSVAKVVVSVLAALVFLLLSTRLKNKD